MLATIMAYHEALNDDVANLVDTNSVFMTAMAIATFVISGPYAEETYPPDVFLIL